MDDKNNSEIKWSRVRDRFFDDLDELGIFERKKAFEYLRKFSKERGEGIQSVEEEYYLTLEPDLDDWLEEKENSEND